MATTRLYRTPGSASNQVKWTWSSWVKLGPTTAAGSNLFGSSLLCAYTDANNYTEIAFQNSGIIDFLNVTGASTDARITTHGMFRDPNAWYHLVFVWDTANVTGGDRMKLYVNGDRIEGTGGIAYTEPSSSLNSIMNSTSPQEIGSRAGGSNYFNGVLAETYFADGQAYAASVFGETDSTSGAWVAKSGPSVTFGTNGYHMKYAAGAFGTDSSGESNTMTVAGTMTTTKDTPDNNFCTMNALDNYYAQAALSNGMNTMVSNASNAAWLRGSMSVTKGKWYWETLVSGGLGSTLGIAGTGPNATSATGANNACTYAYMGNDGTIKRSGTGTAYGATYTTGDYIGTYLDLDNDKIYFSKNGTLQNSGTGYTIIAPGDIRDTQNQRRFSPMIGDEDGGTVYTYKTNFGNGSFGDTQLTGTTYSDAGGEGTFKYDMAGTFDGSSQNFRALCTVNLGEYGG